MEPLPIDAVLPRLLALAAGPTAVLSAPPDAGKTTRVPLALMGAPWLAGRVLMLEPRRGGSQARMLSRNPHLTTIAIIIPRFLQPPSHVIVAPCSVGVQQ